MLHIPAAPWHRQSFVGTHTMAELGPTRLIDGEDCERTMSATVVNSSLLLDTTANCAPKYSCGAGTLWRWRSAGPCDEIVVVAHDHDRDNNKTTKMHPLAAATTVPWFDDVRVPSGRRDFFTRRRNWDTGILENWNNYNNDPSV